jgi:acyl-coenzyme A synthetase/AMP-(fatty) acid ligase/acyl carrier protein
MVNNELLYLINEVETETVIPYDKIEKGDKIVKKEFKIDNELNLKISGIELDNFFLSTLIFTLTKFIYSKEILITKLIKSTDNEFIKTIIAKNIDTNNMVKDYLIEINQLISKNDEYEFDELKKINDLIFPDFQYYYQKEDENLNIPESNFTVIIKENIKENTKENTTKIQFIYNSAMYSEKLIELIYNSLIIVTRKFINNPNILLKNISIAESHEIEFKKTGIKSLKELFENIVKDNEDKIALFTNDETLTYNELNQESNKIANSLVDDGLSIGDRVIINLSRDSNLISSILAVIKAGGVIILTNPNDPVQRNNYFKENSKAKITIDENNINTLIKNTNNNNPSTDLNPNDLFAIVYTSGSTGKPKGAILTHESLINRVFYSKENSIIYDVANSDISAFLLSMNVLFVAFLINLIAILSLGETVVLCDEEVNNNPIELYELFKKTHFDLMATVPSLVESYLKIEPLKELIGNLKILCVFGEKSTDKFIETVKKYTTANIYNIYGSTETNGMSNIKLLNDNITGVGKAQFNVDEKITDIDGNPLPVGVIGELWIGGPSTSKGYINNPQLTEDRFIKINDYNYFKSGDFAKFDENAEVEIIGRMDNQIKINGQRINPSEIENNIPENIGIDKVLVLAKNNENNDKVLCLYFTTKSSSGEISKFKDKIRNHLKNILPNYMIPNVCVYLDEFPLNATGKVDMNKLPEPNFTRGEYIPPKNHIQTELVDMFSNVLALDKNMISVNDDFFDFGGDSIKAIQLVSQIKSNLDKTISVNDIFQKRTILELESLIINRNEDLNIVKHDKQKFYPLSPNQVDYLTNLDNLGNEGDNAFNLNFSANFNPKYYNVYKLKEALIKTININSYIKTCGVLKSNLGLYQKNNEDYEVNIKVHNKALTSDIIDNYFKDDFNLLKPLLFKFEFYYDDENIFLLMSFHHGISDLYSIGIFLNDLIRVYNGENFSKDYDYYDYTLDYFENTPKENVLKFGKKQILAMAKSELSNLFKKEISKLTEKFSNKIEEKEKAKFFSFNVKIDENIINFCNKYKITENDLIFYTLLISLKKFLGTDEILVNYVLNGRNNPKYVNTFGLISRELRLLFKLKEESIESSLDYIKDSIYLKMENFSKLKQNSKKQNIFIRYNYLANFITNFVNNTDNLTVEPVSQNNAVLNIDKNFLLFDIIKNDNNELLINLSYNSYHYNNEDIEKLVEYVNNFLNTIK